MGSPLVPVLIGGSITLIGTLLVQVLVIPRVQVATRHRERWEQDVIEMTALVEEELPRALDAYKVACIGPMMANSLARMSGVDRERLALEIPMWDREQQEADKVVGEKISRLDVFERRIKRLHSSSPYWPRLGSRRVLLRVALWDVEPVRFTDDPPDEETWAKSWLKIDERRGALLDVLLEIADPPRPPSRQIIPRLKRRLAPGSLRTANPRSQAEPTVDSQGWTPDGAPES